jgi:hypothetical protein
VLAFAAPCLSGVLGRLLKGRAFFTEYDSIACAGERVNAGLSPYAADFGCAGMHAQPFVYLPWVADAAGAALRAVGPDAMRSIYIVAYIAALALIGWLVFLRKATPGRPIERAPFLALITGSAIDVGNIAIPIAALVAVAALSMSKRPLVFIAIVALAGAIKPFQLTYLALIPIALGGSLTRRAAYSAVGAVLGVGVFAAATRLGEPAMLSDWLAAASRMALQVAPGEGLFGWIFGLGLSPPPVALGLAAAGFAAAVVGAAMVAADRAKLDIEPRIWLGMTAAALATPRLMQIDLLLLGPGLVALAAATCAFAPRAGRRVSQLIFGGACAAVLLSLADLGDVALKAATAMFALAVLIAAAAGFRSRAHESPAP